ncbi:MAG TPA: 8-amino-7-oxononanoate synthase [Flavobacteriales bacterium]|nr:8-amino-7-oxononanoate synthase [Flavobacteriales bacterium]
MPQWLLDRISSALQKRNEEGSLRSLKKSVGLSDFSSNNYLGLANSPQYGIGSTGSRLISGNSIEAENFERYFAEFTGYETALLYNSGYAANTGVIACLAARNDTVIYDELVHASIRDGIRLSLAKAYSFRHNDPNDLRKKCEQASGPVFILTESVFSMDGDEAPLKHISDVSREFDAALIVDEAHAFGVFGKEGRGLVNETGIQSLVTACIFTFGKAAGVHGAAVAGDRLLVNYLLNFSRSFIFTTALPPNEILRIESQINRLVQSEKERTQLKAHIEIISGNFKAYGDRYIVSRSPIQCLIVPGVEAVRAFSTALQNDGFDIRPIMSPTVRAGTERVRICLHAYNTSTEIDRLLGKIQSLMNQ